MCIVEQITAVEATRRGKNCSNEEEEKKNTDFVYSPFSMRARYIHTQKFIVIKYTYLVSYRIRVSRLLLSRHIHFYSNSRAIFVYFFPSPSSFTSYNAYASSRLVCSIRETEMCIRCVCVCVQHSSHNQMSRTQAHPVCVCVCIVVSFRRYVRRDADRSNSKNGMRREKKRMKKKKMSTKRRRRRGNAKSGEGESERVNE